MKKATRRSTAKRPASAPAPSSVTNPVMLRLLASSLADRLGFTERAGLETFAGKRDVAKALGYLDKIKPKDYRARYERNEIAQRVVEALPAATWRGGAELVEEDAPEVVTPFETAWIALADRIGIWDLFKRTDVLAGLGHYAVLLLGAKGSLESELPKRLGPEAIVYLMPFGQADVDIKSEDLIVDTSSSRFGLPMRYTMTRVAGAADTRSRKVHWTRILHVADGLLDDRLMGRPRLRAIWNRLDDLDKVVGAGSEAFWQRVNPGYQIKLDKDVALTETGQTNLEAEIDEWMHKLRRYARLRGASLEQVGESQVANFANQIDSIMSLISAGSTIPKRILIGSERGELASQQDRSNWDQQVSDRRDQFAGPQVVRALVDRLVLHGVLPQPTQYEVRWPAIRNLDEKEIAEVAKLWADINQSAGEEVVSANEIRDRVLRLPPREDSTPVPLPIAARRFLTKGRSRGQAAEGWGLTQRLAPLVAAARSGEGFEAALEQFGAWVQRVVPGEQAA